MPFDLPSFLIPAGTSGPDSPSQVAHKRKIVDAMISQIGNPENVGQGINALSKGIVAAVRGGQADAGETAGTAHAKEIIDALVAKEGGATLKDYAGAMTDPWAAENPGAMTYAQAGLGQAFKQADPANQLDMKYKQAQIDALGAKAEAKPPEMKTIFDPKTGREQSVQWNPDTQNWDPVGGVKAPSSPMVSVNTGDDPSGTGAFYKGLDAKSAESISGLIDAGIQAKSAQAKIGQLTEYLKTAPQGVQGGMTQLVGAMGLPTDGISEVQAAQALINQLVPQQRPAGSGTMSDADLALFKSSLPQIMNQPGGNQMILQTMAAIADYTVKEGEIATQIANREITPTEGRNQLMQLPNPLEGIKGAAGQQSGTPTAPVKPGADGVYDAGGYF